MSPVSALAVFSRNALHKSTFYLLFYLPCAKMSSAAYCTVVFVIFLSLPLQKC